ncbi:hypothetical protein ACFYWS_25980 [Streptomyces sp. NPDC002795]|uniref:hypothetical protein n=1 Tax=Streptomyces sp. NPDC002795 TaxID=3364665 RepID=UPI0036D07FD7
MTVRESKSCAGNQDEKQIVTACGGIRFHPEEELWEQLHAHTARFELKSGKLVVDAFDAGLAQGNGS